MQDKNVQYLCAKIAGHWLGFDVNDIVEIATPGTEGVSELSDSGESVEYHGKEIRTIYMTELLTGDKIRYKAPSKLLIAKGDDGKVGLVVDSAEEILRTSIDRVKNDNINYQGNLSSDFIDGVIKSEDKVVHIISLQNINSLLEANI